MFWHRSAVCFGCGGGGGGDVDTAWILRPLLVPPLLVDAVVEAGLVVVVVGGIADWGSFRLGVISDFEGSSLFIGPANTTPRLVLVTSPLCDLISEACSFVTLIFDFWPLASCALCLSSDGVLSLLVSGVITGCARAVPIE